MGYLYNHLATVVCAIFAGVLTLLWPLFVDLSAVYDLVFMMAVPIMWFLTAVCFVAQRSADYVHGHQPSHKSAKKLTYTSDGQVSN
jgi:hypothetical protein|tara:strand:+ start:807 stop:1064 length:258 start_codon:yes stop_codon:yes gene_type:complete